MSEDTLSNDVMEVVNAHAMEDLEGAALTQARAALNIPEGEPADPRCLRWFWAWVGAFAACVIGAFVAGAFRDHWTTLQRFQAATIAQYLCFVLMGALIVSAVWWKGTINCENSACVWLADRVRGKREELEAREDAAHE